MSATQISVPPAGCYVPAITFFKPDTDELDLNAQKKYYTYLASTGLKGLVILGTNAETFLLSRKERRTLLQLARESVPRGFPIIAGVSGHSTSQVLEYITDAHQAGSDYVLLLPAAYFGKQTTPAVVNRFFDEVAKASPLPIILYNFPAVCNGLDLDSDIIADITNRNPNVVGVKLTCGSVAKIARLAATFPPSRFAVFGGQSDFLVGGLACGSAGCIAAFANIFPKSVARLYDLWESGRQEEALKLQQTLSLAEAPTKAGIANTKYAAAIMTAPLAGIANAARLLMPRRPYEEPAEAAKARIRETMEPLKHLEAGSPSQARDSRQAVEDVRARL
ncbi:4-hydroxy-2-oxoglutarate aldolase-like protein 4 [Elsinoe fawcettii]|nr:4-hydroxy-2-oxoglutarate aldolase-like protein 4 [Elsinoe fawcettii]